MSSGQWEVVGKGKKEKQAPNGKVKPDKDDKKRNQNNAKWDDFGGETPTKVQQLPQEQGKDKKQKSKGGKEDKVNNPENKAKNQPKKQNDRKTDQSRKPPKSLDAALQALDVEEIKSLIETNQARFLNAPLVWLKELATYLNQKTTIPAPEDVTAKLLLPPSYPLNQLNGKVRDVLDKALADAEYANLSTFYEGMLTSLTHDMSRESNSWGHLLLMQMMSYKHPEFALFAITKCNTLKGSYINQPPIYTSLLWCLGQAGFKTLDVGLKVWQELMVPIIELKKYNKFAVSYLSTLLNVHLEKKFSELNQDQFFYIYDTILSKSGITNKETANEMVHQLPKIRELYLNRKPTKLQVTFNQLMKRLTPQSGKSIDAYQRHILISLSECLVIDDSCHLTFRQVYNRAGKQTVMLLEYLASNPNQILTKLNKKSLSTTLATFQTSCEETLKTKKQDDVSERILTLSKEIMSSKASRKSKKGGGFPWLFASFLVLSSILGGLITYDLNQAGGVFAKTHLGKALKDIGVYETTERIALKSAGYASRTFLWVESNAPPAWEQALNVTIPYGLLAYDILIVAKNQANETYANIREYAIAKAPVVHSTIEHYAPGALDAIGNGFTTTKDAVIGFSSHYYAVTKDYLHTQVFVGTWAPEVLQDKTAQALNSTKTYMVNYYSWVQQQAHVYSKIK